MILFKLKLLIVGWFEGLPQSTGKLVILAHVNGVVVRVDGDDVEYWAKVLDKVELDVSVIVVDVVWDIDVTSVLVDDTELDRLSAEINVFVKDVRVVDAKLEVEVEVKKVAEIVVSKLAVVDVNKIVEVKVVRISVELVKGGLKVDEK
jgi:hypothetical protein